MTEVKTQTTEKKVTTKAQAEKKRKPNLSEYGIQMAEKQKIKKDYGVSEKQFYNYVNLAQKNTVNTKIAPALGIYIALESRLDNIVFRMGLTKTRRAARQMVSHGHIIVNGKKINIPSHKVRINDIITVREGSKNTKLYGENLPGKEKDFFTVNWLALDIAKLEAKILAFPKEIETGFDFAKVLEFYNK